MHMPFSYNEDYHCCSSNDGELAIVHHLVGKKQSILTVQHHVHHTYGRDTPVSKVIQSWFNQYKESGSVEKQKSPGGLQTSKMMMNA
jgi:uncharacterized Fe-S cluster-containing radical SAM superfamily enzyme